MNHPTSRGARRDRRVYWASHPLLFAMLAVLRERPVVRLGRRVLVNGTDAFREVLTEVPLDRTSELTTGGAIRRHEGEGALFDESGDRHRASRRELGRRLDRSGVGQLRCVWTPVLEQAAGTLAAGGTVDLCQVADDVSGRTTAALLGRDLDPSTCRALAVAARRTASAAAAQELPSVSRPWGPRRPGSKDHLDQVLGEHDPLATMLALATTTTTWAAVPRAVARVADGGLWADAADPARRPVLVGELLRVTAPTPLLPRVPAEDTTVGGCPVHAGEQLLLLTRHAVDAHRCDVDVDDPAPAATQRLVFGSGGHACPGARLASEQLGDVLSALAPYAPVVVRARADRRAALPAWRSLVVRAQDPTP